MKRQGAVEARTAEYAQGQKKQPDVAADAGQPTPARYAEKQRGGYKRQHRDLGHRSSGRNILRHPLREKQRP